jgi:hypothetical protein
MGRTTNGKSYNNSHTGAVKTQTPHTKSPDLQPQNTNYKPLFYTKSDKRKLEADLISEQNPNSLLMMHVIAMRIR